MAGAGIRRKVIIAARATPLKITSTFLNKIFKANTTVLNTLLTIFNKKCFDNSSKVEKCPLQCTVGASNKLLDMENKCKELPTLYNWFLTQREVTAVLDEGLQELLLDLDQPGLGSKDDDKEENND